RNHFFSYLHTYMGLLEEQLPSENEVRVAIELLRKLVAEPALLAALSEDERRTLMVLSGQLSRPSRAERRARSRKVLRTFRRREREAQKATDQALLERAQMRNLQPIVTDEKRLRFLPPVAQTPEADEELLEPRACYICKQPFRKVHFFYASMCP